jgi:hypothetical protein
MPNYSVYHWDTFDNETILVKGGFDDLDKARDFVKEHYGKRIRPTGADKVDIVDENTRNIVEQYSVG